MFGRFVVLNSGGPFMFVSHVYYDQNGDETAHCIWQAGRRISEGNFPTVCVTVVEFTN